MKTMITFRFSQSQRLVSSVTNLLSKTVISGPNKAPFHTSPSVSKSRHPQAIRKTNLAKRAARQAELKRSRPSPVVSSNLSTPFFRSLHTPQSARELDDSTSQSYITPEDREFLLEQTPSAIRQETAMTSKRAAGEEKLAAAQLAKVIALRNGNAADVQRWNIRRAVEWFGDNPYDTGNTAVQIAVLTIRIHNLHTHLEKSKKDKHNYRQLRSMVMHRAKLFKYLKEQDITKYYKTLEDLGLKPMAVEGELRV